MTLTLTTGFKEAITSAEAEIRFYVRISSGDDSFYAVSGTVANSTTDRYPEAIRSVAQISSKLDPFTHDLDSDEFFIDVDASWIRPIMINHRLRSIGILECKLGCASQDTDNFMPYFYGRIQDIIPGDDVFHIIAQTGLQRLKDTNIVGFWYCKHPLEVLYTSGNNSGVLTKGGIYSVDADAFNPEHAKYAGIGHLIVGRGGAGESTGYPTGLNTPTSAFEVARQICVLLNGFLVEDELGEMTFRKFDASASAVFNWTTDHIIAGSFKQLVTDENICNSITIRYGKQRNGEWGYDYTADETDSQSVYSDPGSSGLPKKFSKTIDTDWINCTLFPSYHGIPEFAAVDDHIDNVEGDTHLLSGNHNSANAARRVSSTQPLYLRISNPGGSAEYAKCISLDRTTSANHTCKAYVKDPATGATSAQGPYVGEVYLNSLTRGIRGSTAIDGDDHSRIRDITPLVILCDELLARFAYGCPIIEFSTLLTEYAYQIGDVGTVTWPSFCAYGIDGITNTTTWEIIGKELDVYGSPPSIKWTLARCTVITPTLEIAHDSRGSPSDHESGMWIGDEVLTQGFVDEGWTIAVPNPKSLTATITAGSGWLGDRYLTLQEDIEYTFTASKDTYVYFANSTGLHIIEVANGAAAPADVSYMIFIAKVVTDGAGVTSVTTTGQETSPVDGSVIKSGTIAEAQLGTGSVTEAKIGSAAVTTAKVANAAIVEALIGTGAVTETKIGTGAVVEAKLGASSVTADKIGTSAVTEAKVATGAVTAAKVGDAAIDAQSTYQRYVSTALNPNSNLLRYR